MNNVHILSKEQYFYGIISRLNFIDNEATKYENIKSNKVTNNEVDDNICKHNAQHEIVENENEGLLYCMANPIFQFYGNNFYKLGKTTRSFADRANDYTTSYPEPSEELFSVHVSNIHIAENILFCELDECRVFKNREFFRCDLHLIKLKMMEIETLFNDIEDINKYYIDYCELHKKQLEIKKCILCTYDTTNLTSMKQHLHSKKHKTRLRERIDSLKHKYIKNICNECISEKRHICKCGKVFSHQSSLSRHKKTCFEKGNTDEQNNILSQISLDELRNDQSELANLSELYFV
jgi:hypothetical protein